jgi:hypothetical protein
VDQIGQQRDAAARQENDCLGDGSETENRKREQDSTNALPRELDALIDKTMRMTMPAVPVPVPVPVHVGVPVRI